MIGLSRRGTGAVWFLMSGLALAMATPGSSFAACPGGACAAPGGRSTDGGLTFSAFDGGLDNVSSFYADFHMSYLGGSAPRLYLNTWEGIYTTIGLRQGLSTEALRFAATLKSSNQRSKASGRKKPWKASRSNAGPTPQKRLRRRDGSPPVPRLRARRNR